MDIATLIGLITAFGLVTFAITMSGSLSSFVDPVSITIVVGGTIGVILISYPLSNVLGVVGILMKAFMYKVSEPKAMIAQLIELSKLVRKDGILSLEDKIEGIDDAFLATGLQMAVDGQEPDSIEGALYIEMDKVADRHAKGAEILSALGTFAPAMGMIGTLVGLVLMLQNMEDPSSIGPSMAVALLTTFYGALMANLIFLPMAGKLKTRSKDEIMVKELIIAGLMSIVAGENPRILDQKLLRFLPPKDRKSQF